MNCFLANIIENLSAKYPRINSIDFFSDGASHKFNPFRLQSPRRMSQVASQDVRSRLVGCHKLPRRMSQVASRDVTSRLAGCHKSPRRMSEVASQDVTSRLTGCHKSPHRMSQITSQDVTSRLSGRHKSPLRTSQVASQDVTRPGGDCEKLATSFRHSLPFSFHTKISQ